MKELAVVAFRAKPSRRICSAPFAATLALAGWGVAFGDVAILVPGASFESPATNYASPPIDFWQKTPKPTYYNENGGFLWTQLAGSFKNTDASSFDHIDNCDGNQAIWIFAVPDIGGFQDYDSLDWSHTAPIHAFNAIYETGKSYTLTVGIIGGGGGMLEGVSIQISLYYRDGGGQITTVAATSVVHTANAFPTYTHFVDFQVTLPVVKLSDPWAGKNIGIRFLSTVSDAMKGGYWDLDNVRLSSTVEPPVVVTAREGGSLRLSWLSAAGYQYQVEKSDDFQTWTNFESAQSGIGADLFKLYPLSGHANGWFRVKITGP